MLSYSNINDVYEQNYMSTVIDTSNTCNASNANESLQISSLSDKTNSHDSINLSDKSERTKDLESSDKSNTSILIERMIKSKYKKKYVEDDKYIYDENDNIHSDDNLLLNLFILWIIGIFIIIILEFIYNYSKH